MTPSKGQAHDPVARQKISDSLVGKPLTQSHRQRISEGKIEAFLEREKEHEYHYPKSKRCSQCRKRKSSDQFLKKKTKLKSGLTRYYLASECKKCSAKRGKRWRDSHKAKGTSSDLYRRYEKNRSPKSKKYQRQLNRENDAIRRRDKGMKSRAKPEPENAGKRLPREPFIVWLKEELEKRGISEGELATMSGIDDSRIHKIIEGRELGSSAYTRISLSTVDKILVGLDREEMLTILYPE